MAQGGALIARDNTDLTRASTNMGQPGYPAPADQQMAPSDVRSLFLQTALYKSIMMAAQAYPGAAQTVISNVPQTGVANKVRLLSQLTAVVGTALAAGPNSKAPYSHVTNILYTDPSGNNRVNASAYSLYLLDIVKMMWGWEPSNGSVSSWSNNSTINALIYSNPTPGTTAANVIFFNDIPFCMSDRDTRGSMVLESSTSPSTLAFLFNPTPLAANGSATSIDSPYTNNATATTLTMGGTIQGVYYFWQPSYVKGPNGAVLPLPTGDFNLIHELFEQRSANLLANNENRYTFPTGRSYYRVVSHYVNNNAFAGTSTADVVNVKFAYDQSNYVLNESLQAYYTRIRRSFDRDLPAGTFVWDFTRRPWDSSHYGQLDAILQFGGTTLTSPYVSNLRETLHRAPVQ
jgi:hypothetical protein